MADYVKFHQFMEDLTKGVHQMHSGGHTFKVYLTNTSPNVSTHKVKGDLAGITEQNGYSATSISNNISRSGLTVSFTGSDVTWTASGGNFGPFRYAVIFNDTPNSPADPLMCYYDYGESITVKDGESFKVDFGDAIAAFA